MIEIKGFPGYFLDDDQKHIIGKKGKPLRPHSKCVVLSQNGQRVVVPLNKLIFCAQNKKSPDEIPKGISFQPKENGEMEPIAFERKMSSIFKRNNNIILLTNEQIAYFKEYFSLLEEVIKDTEEAKTRLFTLINKDREDYILYAYKLGGKLKKETAEMFADDAILTTMETICIHRKMVVNPRGCVRTYIREYVRKNRQKIRQQKIMITDII